MKITFMGAGSTVFARNVIGDCMLTDSLKDSVFALYDIDAKRIEESRMILEAMKKTYGGFGKIECYVGIENRSGQLSGGFRDLLLPELHLTQKRTNAQRLQQFLIISVFHSYLPSFISWSVYLACSAPDI